MNARRRQLRKIVPLIGLVLLIASAALAAGSVRPTEARWTDQVRGEATFGLENPSSGRNFARSFSAYGFSYPLTSAPDPGALAGPLLTVRNPSLLPSFTAPIEGRPTATAGIVSSSATATGCVRSIATSPETCPVEPTVRPPGAGPAISFASSELSTLRINALGATRVDFGSDRSPNYAAIIATAACSPGRDGVSSLLSDGPILIGNDTSLTGDNRARLSVPTKEDPVSRAFQDVVGAAYKYEAILRLTTESRPGYGLTQLRLDIKATGKVFGDDWSAHLILAHAECGMNVPEILPPIPPSRLDSPLRQSARVAAAPAALQPVIDVTGQSAESQSDVGSLPALDQADHTAADEQSGVEPGPGGTTNPEPATPAATSPAAPTKPSEVQDAIPGNAPTETAATDPAEQATAPEGPPSPELARVGREFAVVTRNGVELGTARIDDVVRTPGCGVELTLSIRTSAEEGPGRWASIGPGDFAEVRPGGSIRKAGRVSSDCEQAADSRVTALSAGREYEIVIAIALDDSAQRAMLRPDGTAGWMFDLPPLPKDAATTSPSASAPTSSPATAPGEPSVETSVNTAEA